MSSIWNLVGIIFCSAWRLTDKNLPSQIPQTLAALLPPIFNDNDGKISKSYFLSSAAVFIAKALELSPKIASYWTNLAIASFRHANHLKKSDASKDASNDCIDDALSAMKMALSIDSKSPDMWNIFGAIAHSAQKNSLAQHCYIKSLQFVDVNFEKLFFNL